MQIDRFDFYPNSNTNDSPITMGLNIGRKYGLTSIHIFALSENKGSPISQNLWQISRQIIEEILNGERVDSVSWAFTAQNRTTGLKFSLLNGQPYKLDISDTLALDAEAYGVQWDGGKWTIEYYAKKHSEAPRINLPSRDMRRLSPDAIDKTVFCVPCDHSAAQDGVFHCIPAYYDADHMRDQYEYVLVDTQKLIAQLRHDDPGMLEHAERNFSGSKAEEWVQSTSIEHPRDMGQWGYSPERGLTFIAGQAALIKLVHELNLAYFPIAIEKAAGEDNINELKRLCGYGSLSPKALAPSYNHP